VAIDFGEDKMLEMSEEHDPLDLPVVPAAKLRLVTKYGPGLVSPEAT
jgi:hypothetical protein